MASLKKKQRSPYWYIKYRDDAGLLIEESTNLRHDSAGDTRQAKILKAQRTQEELEHANNDPVRGRWDRWVPEYMQVRYEQQDETLIRNQTRWRIFEIFLNVKKIVRVQQLKREHAFEYMKWRKAGNRAHHVRRAHHNTARGELKFVALLLDEAVHREYISHNPFHRLGIKKLPSKEKPEMTDEEIEICRTILKDKPGWMGVAFEIALYTGCRLAETNVIIDDVVLGPKSTFLFRDPKGGVEGSKDYTVPMRVRGYLTKLSRVAPMISKDIVQLCRQERALKSAPNHCFTVINGNSSTTGVAIFAS